MVNGLGVAKEPDIGVEWDTTPCSPKIVQGSTMQKTHLPLAYGKTVHGKREMKMEQRNIWNLWKNGVAFLITLRAFFSRDKIHHRGTHVLPTPSLLRVATNIQPWPRRPRVCLLMLHNSGVHLILDR